MKIVIFGATGYTGLCSVKAALDKGYSTRIFVRNIEKVPDEYKDKVEIFVGNVLNYNDVLSAVKDIEAVVVVLGTRNDLKATTDLSDGLKNIIKAMKENKVEIVSVCLSAFLFYEESKIPAIFKDLNADHQRMFDALKQSELKYIACLPPHIADEPEGGYKIEYDKSPGRVVSKYDLGKFLVNCLSQSENYRRVCGIVTVKNA